MEILFWSSLAWIVYAYAGYPLLLCAVSALFKKPVRKKALEPKVSIVVSAFNEEKAIARKLHNLLALNYPVEKLEILIGSDGASDKTDEIISQFPSPQVRFFRFVENLGKPHVLSALAKEADGEMIVFTDTRQELDREAIRALAANFADPEVGCVSGELHLNRHSCDRAASIGKGIELYWRYEKFLRKKESELSSMLGATGALYAIRKDLFPKRLPMDVLVDDMYVPFDIINGGHRAVFESEACAYDYASRDGTEEFKRKVRTLAGNFQIFMHFPKLFVPLKSPIAWQLFSHKFLRLVVPFLLIKLFVVNLFLTGMLFYNAIFLVQVLFYGLAILEAVRNYQSGGTASGRKKRGIGYVPYTFCLLNYSAIIGFFKFVTRKQAVTWEKAYA